MKEKVTEDLTQELFQVLGQVTRLKWEKSPIPGLKPSECELLGILHINLSNGARRIAASELSSQLKITPAAITHLLNPLDEAGLISRKKDPSDRRYVLIGLTDRGKILAKSLVENAQETLEGLVQYIGEEESREMLLLMTKLLEYFSDNQIKQYTFT
jgi:DNA-binding MarR family transcriptional regulator